MRLFGHPFIVIGIIIVAVVIFFVALESNIQKINHECDRGHGIVVHGQQGEPGVGWSGYVCIEKGKH